MANAPDNASDFVSDFDQEVGVLRRDLDGVYRQTRQWPEFMDYEPGDVDPHILYEGEVPVSGKAYSAVGWYVFLNPSKREDPNQRYDYHADIQFQYDNESWHNYSDWYNVVCKWQLPKVAPENYPAYWRIDPAHIELAYAKLKEFVDKKLSPVLLRGDMNAYYSPRPKTTAECLVDLMLEGEVSKDRLGNIYSRIWNAADQQVRKHNPCGIKKDASGKTICAGCKGHDKHREGDVVVKPNEMCCMGCEHHGPEGCQANEPATCKTWLCNHAYDNMPKDARDRLHTLSTRLSRAGLYSPRASKDQAVGYAAYKHGLSDDETPLDDYRKRMSNATRATRIAASGISVESLVSHLLGEDDGQAQYRCKWCDKTHSLDAVPRTWRELSHFFASQDIYDVKCYKQGGTWVLQAGSRSMGLGLRNLKWMTFGDWLKNYHYIKKGIAQDRAADDAHERWAQTRFNNPNDEEEYAGDPVNAS